MKVRIVAAALLVLAVALYAAVAIPMQRQAAAAADEYRRARDDAREVRARLARLERRDAAHARASHAVNADTPGAAVRAVRRSVVQTLQSARLSGVRLGVVAARAPYTTRVHLTAAASFADAVAFTGLLARPETGVVLERIQLTPRGDGVGLDVDGVTLGQGGAAP